MESILDKVIISKQVEVQISFNPSEFVSQMLSWLTDREANVVKLRFGLDGSKPLTLEKIGQSYQITRERVRQIERSSVAKIRSHNEFPRLLHPIKHVIINEMKDTGGARETNQFLRDLFQQSSDNPAHKNVLIFVIEYLIDEIEQIKDEEKLPSWRLKDAELKFYDDAIGHVIDILKLQQEPLLFDDLWTQFLDTPLYREKKHLWIDDHPLSNNEVTDEHLKEALLSYIHLSKFIDRNPYEEWGLCEWPSITPKRMSDKIYLVLKKNGSPLHFNDITESINRTKFDSKIAHAPTVHNELILDPRFVLVGRGIYALGEWGYREGVVSDVILDVLRNAQTPLSREEIVNEVSKRRIVKRGTIYLALSDKKKFVKLDDGRYEVNSKFQDPTG